MPELPKCNDIPIYVTCVYWKYHRVFSFHPCGWMIRFTQEKAFRSLGNAHSLSFSEIDLYFSLLNFLVPLEGWGHFSDWFSPEKKKENSTLLFCWPFRQPPMRHLCHRPKGLSQSPCETLSSNYVLPGIIVSHSWCLPLSTRWPAPLPLKFIP